MPAIQTFAWIVVAFMLVLASACPRNDDVVDAGADAGTGTVDAGGGADANVDAGNVIEVRAPAIPDPLSFRFARMRTPTAGGEEIVRIGENERVRLVDGVLVEERAAPSAEALAKLVAACANNDVADALRKPGDTSPSMTLIELGCAPVQGVLGCDPSVPSTCGGAFVDVKAAITEAWQEDSEATRTPSTGITVRTTRWEETHTSVIETAFVMIVNGKPLLPAKDEPFSRAPARKRVVLCSESYRVCTDVVAPARVHVDVVGNDARFRCPSCAPAQDPRVPVPAPMPPGATLSKVDILTVMKGTAIPRIQRDCARATGPDVVKLAWTIQPSGAVKEARDTSGANASARGRCAAAVMSRMTFPRSSSTMPISFPIKVVP